MKKANGRPLKFKKGTETKMFQKLVPTAKIPKIVIAIEEICAENLNK